MALPLTRDTTYVAGTTPTIKAGDLNNLQDYEIHIFQGSKSVKKMHIDGTSDAATSVPDGGLRLSAVSGSDTLPTAATTPGTIYREHILLGYARETRDVFGVKGFACRYQNVNSLTRNGAGDYTIVLNATGVTAATCMVQITTEANPTYAFGTVYDKSLDGSGRLSVSFYLLAPTTAAKVDTTFMIEIKGAYG